MRSHHQIPSRPKQEQLRDTHQRIITVLDRIMSRNHTHCMNQKRHFRGGVPVEQQAQVPALRPLTLSPNSLALVKVRPNAKLAWIRR
ncbi:hypothetical protein JB92DRAFT_2841268 [Gautieria morchelliformis]|nr:hypothetical protein JB92DRAFT_2841268 [Gautieria morchelliformis]